MLNSNSNIKFNITFNDMKLLFLFFYMKQNKIGNFINNNDENFFLDRFNSITNEIDNANIQAEYQLFKNNCLIPGLIYFKIITDNVKIFNQKLYAISKDDFIAYFNENGKLQILFTDDEIKELKILLQPQKSTTTKSFTNPTTFTHPEIKEQHKIFEQIKRKQKQNKIDEQDIQTEKQIIDKIKDNRVSLAPTAAAPAAATAAAAAAAPISTLELNNSDTNIINISIIPDFASYIKYYKKKFISAQCPNISNSENWYVIRQTNYKNSYNICYLHSVLQLLRNIKELVEILREYYDINNREREIMDRIVTNFNAGGTAYNDYKLYLLLYELERYGVIKNTTRVFISYCPYMIKFGSTSDPTDVIQYIFTILSNEEYIYNRLSFLRFNKQTINFNTNSRVESITMPPEKENVCTIYIPKLLKIAIVHTERNDKYYIFKTMQGLIEEYYNPVNQMHNEMHNFQIININKNTNYLLFHLDTSGEHESINFKINKFSTICINGIVFSAISLIAYVHTGRHYVNYSFQLDTLNNNRPNWFLFDDVKITSKPVTNIPITHIPKLILYKRSSISS